MGHRILFTYKKGTPPQTEYGYLYNWWAAIGDTDGDHLSNTSIANDGWHLPSKAEWETLMVAIGATNDPGELWGNAGVYLKSEGFTYWDDSGDPSDYGLDTYGMNIRGYGERRSGYQGLKSSTRPWTSTGGTDGLISVAWEFQFVYNQSYSQASFASKWYGQTVRLVKDDSTLEDYVGNNGIVYPTVKIGTQVWTVAALEETKYRDGTDIPLIGNTAADQLIWNGLTTGAYSIYPIP